MHKGTFIEYRRHDSNASKGISHGYKYKVNEINRTIQVNNWYLNAFDVDLKKRKLIENCSRWCEFRKKLIVDKKVIVSIGEGIDVMMYLEIPTVFPACFSFLNYKVDLLPSVY